MSRFALALTATLSLLVSSSAAAFAPQAKTNVAVYWGQGPYQARLVETCKNPNIDVVIIGFVNVFPDQGKGGYPGTNFGNACGAATFKNKAGKQTQLLSSCPDIGPDITTCQTTYGKKVLLSLGGGYPTNYFIGSDQSAVSFANFVWGAFGPVTSSWTSSKGPRPFGTAVIDGFDFDIESDLAKAPTFQGKPVNDYRTRGYVKMIQTLKQTLYPTDKSKTYYITGSPQCLVPDAHFAKVVSSAWFDYLYIQFYNTPLCSARAGVNYIEGASSIDISYSKWSKVTFFNKNLKIYIGVPGSKTASNSLDYYLPPLEANLLIKKYYSDAKFGGVMLWEATYAMSNVVCGKNYPTWIKQLLNAAKAGTTINTVTDDCPSVKVKCGSCSANPVSTDGRCGPNFGSTCAGSSFGPCCSTDGYCSSSYSVCSSAAGCDSQYADCTAAAAVQPSRMLKRQDDASSNSSVIVSANSSAAATPAPVVALPTNSSDASASSETVSSSDVATSSVPSTNATEEASSPAITDAPTMTSSATVSASDEFTYSPETAETASIFDVPSTERTSAVTSEIPTTSASTEASTEASPEATITAPAQKFATVTVFTTLTSTITESDTTKVITSTIPIATSTITVEDAPISTVVSSTITTCEPDITSCSASPALQTRTTVLTNTITLHQTVTVPSAEATFTSYSTAYYTTIVNLALNPDNTLYNPHADAASSQPANDTTRTTKLLRTETVELTQTVTPLTTTEKGTTTVLQYVTVAPVAKFPEQKGAGEVVVNRVKADAQLLSVTVEPVAAGTARASASQAEKVVQQTNSNGGAREVGSVVGMMVVGMVCGLALLL
ncbi:Chitinase 1 [Elsinoe australis]|uniref:chitinase n=1 Tax=Elsinoe australis TaxID=40998 RepID=A0A2P7ZCY0_9PEZI|nr:Chitinase 1 [Elsinoe australis]